MSSACPIFAFSVHLALLVGSDDSSRQMLVGAFLQFTRGRGLDVKVRASDMLDFVVRGEAMQATDADRDAVEQWLRERPDLAHWTVGVLRDLQED